MTPKNKKSESVQTCALKAESFSSLKFQQIGNVVGRELRLDPKPAVYAWYRSLQMGQSAASPQAFLSRIETLLEHKLSDHYSSRLGYLYEVTIQESGGKLPVEKQRLLEKIALKPDARSVFIDILDSSTFLQAPLYVGKASNLRKRIGQHVDGQTGLLRRLESAGIKLESCTLRFRYIEQDVLDLITDATGFSEDSIVALIEDLLTRFSPAAFVRRVG